MALAIGIASCSSFLFAIGLCVAGWGGGNLAWDVWQERREEQAALSEARASCAGSPYDPTASGTPAEQIEGCVGDATDGYGQGTHPVVFIVVFAGAFYLVMTGSVAWAAWAYRRNDRPHPTRRSGWTRDSPR